MTKWLVGGALTAAAAWGALAGGLWGSRDVSRPRVAGLVPDYEPIQYRGKDSLTSAQKAKFQDIYNFATADMERRHVSARKFNQFLWQMHFFVPVKYKPFNCTELKNEKSLEARANDYIAMGEAMRDTYETFWMTLPMHNAEAQSSGGEISLDGLHKLDSLQTYSLQLREFMLLYRDGSSIYSKDTASLQRNIRAWDSWAGFQYFDPLLGHCSHGGEIFLHDGFYINARYIDLYFGADDPAGFPASPRRRP